MNGKLKFKSTVSPNYETKSTYAVTITSTDASGSALAQNFSVTINDVNEAPTSISLSASAIDENAAAAVAGTLTGVDQDANDTITFSLSGTDGDSFEVVDGKLQLKSGINADYETQTSYSFTVVATDNADNSCCGSPVNFPPYVRAKIRPFSFAPSPVANV